MRTAPLLAALALALAASTAAAQMAAPGRPRAAPSPAPPAPPTPANLLVVYVDDLVSAASLPAVATPHLDALAGRGVRFRRAYAAHPLCNPSRVALLSGRRTHRTETVYIGYAPPEEIGGLPYLPRLLRDAGYHVARAGKIFHHAQPTCWDEAYALSTDEGVVQPVAPPVPFAIYGGAYENGPDGALGKMQDTKHTDKALQLLWEARQRLDATGQPFAIWLGLRAPHEPFVYPERFADDYDASDVPPLPPGEGSGWQADVGTTAWSTPWTFDEAWGATEEQRRVQATLAYMRCAGFVDEQLGRVLDTLDASGLAASTTVVFVSDHGQSLGRHAHAGKTTGYDEDALAPLVVAHPGLPGAHGSVVSRPVEQVDLYPTIVELLGLELPSDGVTLPLDGVSLVPQLVDPDTPHGPVFYTTDEQFGFHLTRHVVEQDASSGRIWKLAAWELDADIDPVPQLYDLTGDPGEYANVHDEPQHASRVAALRERLRAVGLLGPSTRRLGVSVAGSAGAPELALDGAPTPGASLVLHVGALGGLPTTGALVLGVDGVNPVLTGPALAPLTTLVVQVPPGGLALPALVPDDPALLETSVGAQLLVPDATAPGGVALSRAVVAFVSD